IPGPFGGRKSKAPMDGAGRLLDVARLSFPFEFETVLLYRLRADDRDGTPAGARIDATSIESTETDFEKASAGGGYARRGQPGSSAATDLCDGFGLDAVAGDGRGLRRICTFFLHFGRRVDGLGPQSRLFRFTERESRRPQYHV